MPLDACQWFYECTGCGALLEPRRGDCCVFCSWGSVPCPPVQLNGRSGCCQCEFLTTKDTKATKDLK